MSGSTHARPRVIAELVAVGAIVVGTFLFFVLRGGEVVVPVFTPLPVEPLPLPATQPAHKAVHLRLGTITALQPGSFTLKTPRLVGEGDEEITVALVSDTTTLEIRIPSYLGAADQQTLKEGKTVVQRVPVLASTLHTGQQVAVVCVEDMFGQSQVTASRVEYKTIVNTENR